MTVSYLTLCWQTTHVAGKYAHYNWKVNPQQMQRTKEQAPLPLRTRQSSSMLVTTPRAPFMCKGRVKAAHSGSTRCAALCSIAEVTRSYPDAEQRVWEMRIRGNEKGRKRQKEITYATESKHSSVKAKQKKIPGRFRQNGNFLTVIPNSLKSWVNYMDSPI